jgi:hypothetical protein
MFAIWGSTASRPLTMASGVSDCYIGKMSNGNFSARSRQERVTFNEIMSVLY